MSFTIDLDVTIPPFIKLQVYKNTITLYFYGDTQKNCIQRLCYWNLVDEQCLKRIPTYNPKSFREPNPSHIKLHHTHIEEIGINHFHREFTEEITPTMLSDYLFGFWGQQNEEDKIIENIQQIHKIISIFTDYYDAYKNSIEEKTFNTETKLTAEEDRQYQIEKENYVARFDCKRSKHSNLMINLSLSMWSIVDTLKEDATRLYSESSHCQIM